MNNMPELPEVETIVLDLKKTIVDATIVDFWTDSPKQVLPSIETVREEIVGDEVVGVERAGKLVLIEMYNVQCKMYNFLGIHLKMSGRILLRSKNDPSDKYCHALFTLKHSKQKKLFELRFCDTRKFGYIRLFKNKEDLENSVQKKLGPEPFSPGFTAGYLQKTLSRKNIPIKTIIMDQSIISGVGNIYANEALFLAGIDPRRKTSSLKFKEFKSLRESLLKVLNKGIKYRGSSSKDKGYVDLYGKLGSYQEHFLVYEKKGKSCPNSCLGVIKYQRVNGRGTFWCEKCQK